MGVPTPQGMKEEGGSNCGPVLAMGTNFRPEALGRAPGWGRALPGTRTVWAFSEKRLFRGEPVGGARPRSRSLGVSGLSKGKAGAGQASASS